MVTSLFYPSRLGWPAWVSGLAAGTAAASLSWPGVAGSPALRVGAVLFAAAAGVKWLGGRPWRLLLLPMATALALAGPWTSWSAPAAAGLVGVALIAVFRGEGVVLVLACALVASGLFVLGHSIEVFAQRPAQTTASWLTSAAALAGAGLSLFDRENDLRRAVARFGGGTLLALAGFAFLVLGVVIVGRGEAAGAKAVGGGAALLYVAVYTFMDDDDLDLNLLMMDWTAGSLLGMVVGGLTYVMAMTLQGQPAVLIWLLPILTGALLLAEMRMSWDRYR